MLCVALMMVVDYTAAVLDRVQKRVPCDIAHCSVAQPCPLLSETFSE